MLACWEKISDIVPGIREAFQSPVYLRNLETAAGRYAKHLEKRAPGSYAAFSSAARG